MKSLPSYLIGQLHEKYIFSRRVQALSDWFSRMVPHQSSVLDVGCGSGLLSKLLQTKRPDISITGIDVIVRPQTYIPVVRFDGVRLPCEDDSYDVAIFCDVLHHTSDPMVLLREASRVARCILIKDHFNDGFAANVRLCMMDWIGNARFGVALSYNYWSRSQWNTAWRQLGLREETIVERLHLYRQPIDCIFGNDLHFIALLKQP